MPQHMAERRWRGRVISEIRAVFAGCVFFRAAPFPPQWHKVRTAPGVTQFIGFGANCPAEVPLAIVAGLMQRCDAEGLLQQEQDLSPGDRVPITKGPFREFITTIEKIDRERRIHVFLELMGRETKVILESGDFVRRY